MHNKRSDWVTVIPIIFCCICIAFSIAKMFQSEEDLHIIDYLEAVNSNVFSTFISMVIVMAYQVFSKSDPSDKMNTPLNPKYMWLTVIATVAYGSVALINACRYCLLTSLIMTVATVVYVYIFFKYMRKYRAKNQDEEKDGEND